MYKCMLGCGLVVHDVDEHIDTTHAAQREVFSRPFYPGDGPIDWDVCYRVGRDRERFMDFAFHPISLS
jgi:hypothetical protein